MKQPVLLGIDAGTSGGKVCAFTPEGALVRKESEQIAVVSPQEGYAELDVEHYWALVAKAVRRLCGPADLEVLGVGFSTTCPTVIALDRNLRPLAPGITYLDSRAAGLVADYQQHFPSAAEYVAHVGNRASVSSCSSASMRWLRARVEGNVAV